MKKAFTGGQIALILVTALIVCFAVMFGAGWLLSKAVWLAKLNVVESAAAWLWIVLYGLYLLFKLAALKKHPVCAKLGWICQLAAFFCITVKMIIFTAFRFAGIN